MTPPGPLRQLHDLDRTSPQFHEQLSNYLRGDEYQNVVPSLQGEGLAWLVEYLDSVLGDISDPPSLGFKEFLHELGKHSVRFWEHPQRFKVTNQMCKDASKWSATEGQAGFPRGSRGVETLSTSKHRPPSGRHHRPPPIHFGSDIRREPDGIHRKPSKCKQGGSRAYPFRCVPCTTRLLPRQLSDVVQGLNYLHSCNVIHGGLKGVRGCIRSRLTTKLKSI
ncbi:hypothetical protein BDM02DRAFT_1708197 [Thelephora ganbajun]|uniref:Uncharacterized protein n=1 Tax=Thelephora ganbajun TaxID=370292 RepID=A0ACB6Z0K6_THEGA|nr:hypothetical protein BDM02DRAFT_1708197 [Thelephora ganbajun]